jgi:hypothetical protein
MHVHRKCMPQEILDAYNLTDEHFDSQGCAYLEIRKGMHGLKEASILAYDQLKECLAPCGYAPAPVTPGLWRHNTRRTTFTLAVDDFGIKCFRKVDAEHLFSALKDKCSLTQDWSGSNYLGMTLDWNHTAVRPHVDVSVPKFVDEGRSKHQHLSPKFAQHAPHLWSKPVCGQKAQHATADTSSSLDKKGTARVQGVSGTFLHHGRAIDHTVLPALKKISNNQARPTEITSKACDHLMDCLATHPDAVIRFCASGTCLCVVSDAACLVLPHACSRCAGLFFLSDHSTAAPPQTATNGAVHVLCKTVCGVPASAAKAKTIGLFVNAQEAIPMMTALEEMGHKQPLTGDPLETDNSTADGVLKAQARMKRSKAFDMRYHWLKDRIARKQFNLCWAPGKANRADYFSKHHPPSHHKMMRPQCLQRPQGNALPTHMQGCVTPLDRLHV